MEDQYESQESVVEAPVDAGQSFNEPVTTGETGVHTEVAAPAPDEPKFGEALKAELARREAQLEKKYKEQYGDYDTFKQRSTELERYQQQMERVAKLGNYANVDAFINALDEAERQDQIRREAEQLGVDESVILDHLYPMKQELEQLKQERDEQRKQEFFRNVDTKVNELKTKYPDFEQYHDQAFDMFANRGYDLEDAYKLLSYESRMQKLAQEKEQEVLARVTGRDQKQILPSNDQPSNVQFDPANMSLDQIQEISRRVQRGERITFN